MGALTRFSRLLTFALLLVALLAGSVVAAATANTEALEVGRAIYLNGQVASGTPLQAHRDAATNMSGRAAACVNCHQRSGLGGREGRATIPPITGRYLFSQAADADAKQGLPFVEGTRGDRVAYTDETLARVIREGVNSEGRQLSYLMPSFDLSDSDMAALIVYLKTLDKRRVPGVTATTLHFATIITPDADPIKRQGMLSVLNQFFTDHNARPMVDAPRMITSSKTLYSKSMARVHRMWELHVWELTGPASTWQQQLEARLAREPVFAVLSGLGGKNWQPVHAFCERSAVPCLLPNLELPVVAEGDFYSQYFSRGVLLEAGLMAHDLLPAASAPPIKTVTQVYRASDVGEAAAQELAKLLQAQGIAVKSTVLAADAAVEAVSERVAASKDADALVLWLRPSELAALPASPSATLQVYISGLMGGLENAPLPVGWREQTHIAYPFDLPEARKVRVDFAQGWFTLRKIPVVSLQVQADTYLACGLLSETINHMVDTFVRDYLVERFQLLLEHRAVTGYYPRLALATGQHFASKGGHLVRFAGANGTKLVSEHNWIVP
jgi:cytochrome c553/nucleotide-binding universal stress UspA family protein